ncbi:MAG: maleylpyruvate isomerase family mycothiol-dependent enzyme [Acidimicrobiaceae bacterium]|nr:maleylpyruvate isomerase family mycothiol-dependent enzyme [Acidimicrobiaceae bacterium]
MNDTPSGDETAALLALDALLPGEQAEAELRFGLLPADLADAAALLAEDTITDPPPELRSDTLLRAASRRPPGRPVGAAQPCTPAVAFDRTVEDLKHLLGSLTDAEWNAPAHAEYGRVRDLLAHLVGVERLVLRWLDPQDTDPELPDHVAATRPVIAELADTDPQDITRQWYEGARAVAAAAARDHSRQVVFHDLTLSVDQLLVTRAGELWAHAIDISQAAGRPLPQLDMERMATLCAQLMAAVPLAMAYRGTPAPGRAARFALTGPAGGTWTVPLALEALASEPEVTIIADAAGLCRLAVRRLRPEELGAAIDGDRELGDLVLAGIGSLARD